jgi:hypothetical protein
LEILDGVLVLAKSFVCLSPFEVDHPVPWMLRKKSLKDLLTGHPLKGHSGLGRVSGLHQPSPNTHEASFNKMTIHGHICGLTTV